LGRSDVGRRDDQPERTDKSFWRQRPATAQVTIIERYTRIDRDHLSYEATIDDPGTWTRPWTVAFPRTRDESHGLYEYACHEGNYSLANILRASRAAEASTSK